MCSYYKNTFKNYLFIIILSQFFKGGNFQPDKIVRSRTSFFKATGTYGLPMSIFT